MARTKTKRVTRKELSVTIPTTLNVPPENLKDYCICLFGAKGVGKTSLAAQFKDSLVLMLEPKRRNLSIRQVNIDPMSIKEMNRVSPENTPWKMIQAYVDAVLEDNSVQTVVVDTIDRAYGSCFNHHCYERGINHPSDVNDYGATWVEIREDFEETMNKLLYDDRGLVFLSHTHRREVEGQEDEQWIPTCTPAAWNYMKAVCDYALYYGYTSGNRAITIRDDEKVWCACGSENNFLTTDNEPIGQFVTGNSHTEAHKNLIAAFVNKLSSEKILNPVEKKTKTGRK